MKSFKGVISNWSHFDGCISGTCVIHTDYTNGIEVGQPITTSPVVSIRKSVSEKALVAETKNSYYILI